MVGDGCEGRNKWVGISSTLVWCSAAMRCTGSARGKSEQTKHMPVQPRASPVVRIRNIYILIFRDLVCPSRVLRPQIIFIPRTLAIPFLFLFFSLLFFFNRRCSSVSSLHPSSILFISISSYLPSFLPSPFYPPCSSSILLLSFSFIISFCFFLFIVNISCIITSIACTPHTLTSLNTRTKTQTTNGCLHI